MNFFMGRDPSWEDFFLALHRDRAEASLAPKKSWKTGSLKSFVLFIEENFINFLENLAYDCKTIHISLGLEAEPPEASKLKLIH